MPRRKRIDPVDAPIDGDYEKHVVLNKDKGKHYAWIHPDDLGTARARGMVKTERRADGPKSPAEIYDDGDIRVGDLVLMEQPKELYEKRQRAEQARFAQRMGGEQQAIQDHIRRTGGAGETNKFHVQVSN